MKDIDDLVVDMNRNERYAFAHGLVRSYALANDVLSATLNGGGDTATIADARLRLATKWNSGPGAYIDELTAELADLLGIARGDQ